MSSCESQRVVVDGTQVTLVRVIPQTGTNTMNGVLRRPRVL